MKRCFDLRRCRATPVGKCSGDQWVAWREFRIKTDAGTQPCAGAKKHALARAWDQAEATVKPLRTAWPQPMCRPRP